MVKSSYVKSAHYSIYDDYGVNANEVWMDWDWFYLVTFSNIGDDGKATQRLPPDNFTESKGFMRKSIAEVSRSVWPYFCLVLASHIKQDWT